MFTVSDNKTIKQHARQVMRESRPRPVLVTLLFLLILLAFFFFRAKLSGAMDPVLLEPLNDYYQAASSGDIDLAMEYYQEAMDVASSIQPGLFHQVVIYAINIVSYVLIAGYALFIINSVRGTDPSVYNLLDGFAQFLKVIIVSLLRSLIVSVLSFLLIIPGIIASYTYRFSLFILLDNPDMRAMDCLSLSRIMMRGHKARLFRLDLSFIGYILLSLLFPPLLIWLVPYMYSSWVIFYDELKKAEFPQGDLLDEGNDGSRWDE